MPESKQKALQILFKNTSGSFSLICGTTHGFKLLVLALLLESSGCSDNSSDNWRQCGRKQEGKKDGEPLNIFEY